MHKDMTDLQQSIAEHLKAWSKSVSAKPSSSVVRSLRDRPKEAFAAITEYQGPYFHIDPRDISDPLGQLLSHIAGLVPELMIPRMTNGFWASRYMFISAAAASESEVFVPTLIQLITDRSVYIKGLLLHLILHFPHLQVREALPQLKRLEEMKSFKSCTPRDRENLKQVVEKITKGTQQSAAPLPPAPQTGPSEGAR